MSLVDRLARHSAVYTIASILQRGTAFVLVPLYTHVFTPAEYGIVAIITALNAILVVVLPLSLHGAITRFYFEHRNEPERLREFWGTVLVAMAASCAVLGTAFLLTAEPLMRAVLGDVAFWPYVVIGLVMSAAQPFLQVALSIFQSREQPVRYAALSLGHFLLSLTLTLIFVLGAGWGPAGPLVALMISSIVFAASGLFILRRDFRLVLRRDDLKTALAYVLPQIPHGLGAQALTTTDKFFLNRLVSLSAAGVYNVAALFSLAVDLLAQSVNRAYVPAALGALQSGDPDKIEELREAGKTMVFVFCAIGASLTIFSNELVGLVAGPDFAGASAFVPFLAFAGTASGIYYVFVNILFYDRQATRYIPLGTIAGGLASIVLNYILISKFGAWGAAVATLGAQVFTTVVIGLIGHRFERVSWDYWLFTVVFFGSFAAAAALALLLPFGPVANFVARFAGWVALLAVLNFVGWRDWLHLPSLAGRLLVPALHHRRGR